MNTHNPEPVPPELETMISLATQALNEHTNDADLCAACGSAWPCQRAILAEHNLALRDEPPPKLGWSSRGTGAHRAGGRAVTGPTPDETTPRTLMWVSQGLRTRLVHGGLSLDERLAVAAVLATAVATVDAAGDHGMVGTAGVGGLAKGVDKLAALCAEPTAEGRAER